MYQPFVLFAFVFAVIIGVGVLYYLDRIARDIRTMRKKAESAAL